MTYPAAQPPHLGGPHPSVPQPTPTRPFAGLVTRGVALAIDGGVALLLFAIGGLAISLVLAALDVADLGTTKSLLTAGSVWVVFLTAYFVLCWTMGGQTLGMRLMGLQLVNRAGEPPSLCRSGVRYVMRGVSVALLFTGYLLVLVHPRRRTLHDVAAGTFVVYSDVPREVIADALREPAARPAPSATARAATERSAR